MEYNSNSARREDRYGFGLRFQACSDQELVEAFNREVGKENWANARADYLFHLHRALVSRNMDCSSVMNGRTMNLQYKARLVENKLVV